MNLSHTTLVDHITISYYQAIRRVCFLLFAWLFAFILQAQTQKNTAIPPEDLMFSFSQKTCQTFFLSDTEKKSNTADTIHSLSCTSTLYLRQNMKTRRRGIIMRYIPGMFQLERGKHNYLTEVQMRVQHRLPGTVNCKVIAYNSNARYQLYNRFINMGRFNNIIYGPKLFFDNILNPLHKRNKKFYYYNYLFDMPATQTQAATYCLSIKPRFSNEQLLSGIIYINKKTGAVVNFKFKFHHRFTTYNIDAHMGSNGYDILIPNRMRIISDFKLLGNHVHEETNIIAHHNFEELPQNEKNNNRYDYTRFYQLRIDTTRVITSPSYFDSIRPLSLRHIEQKSITSSTDANNSHSITNENYPSPPLLEVCKNKNRIKNKYVENNRTQNLLLSSHAFNWTDNGRIQLQLPPIITPSMMQWSGTRGFSLKTRLQFRLLFNDSINNYRSLHITPYIGYSFKQNQVYWETPISLHFLPKFNGQLTFTAGGGAHIYNNEQAEELNHKLNHVEKHDSVLMIINNYDFHDYRNTYTKATFSVSPTSGLIVSIGNNYHQHTLINWNETAKKNNMIHHLTTLGPSFELKWTPAQYFYKEKQRNIPLFSYYPTFMLKYERGFSIGKGKTGFERIETDIQYRLPLYALRTFYFRMGAGMFSHRQKHCFLDYDYFRFQYMPQGWNDELTGEYQLLNPRFFNESRFYLRFTSTYESPMLMLSRLFPLSRAILNERLYFNLLSVRSLTFYTEIGYGINTHLIDFGTFISITPDYSCRIGGKIVFKLFDN